MFEISELKAKLLPELQEIAKASGVPKFRSLKKLDLVYKILDHQAANPSAVKAVIKEVKTEVVVPQQETLEKKGSFCKYRRAKTENSSKKSNSTSHS